MATTNKTPLWLDLKKEYIDDNFSKLQEYLRKSVTEAKDSFYNTTIDLLRSRVEDLINYLSLVPLYKEERERKEIDFNVRLLASYLLVDSNHPLALSAYIAFMGELRLLNPRLSGSILLNAVKRLRYEQVASLGFSWSDLDKIGTDLFAHNACQNAEFETPLKKPHILSKVGTAVVTGDGMFLSYENEENAKKLLKSGTDSLNTDLNISLRTSSSGKLKQSQENNLPDMESFVKDFLTHKKLPTVIKKPTQKPRYAEGDYAIIRITSISPDGTMHVETANPNKESLSGIIKFERPSIVYYWTNTLYKYFHIGDVLPANVVSSDPCIFTIEQQLIEFFIEDTKETFAEGDEFLGILIDEKPNYYEWLNEYGIAMQSPNVGGFRQGDFAVLSLKGFETGKYYGVIRANVVHLTDESFDDKDARQQCIRAFAESVEVPSEAKSEDDTGELNHVILRLLLRQMSSHQKNLLKPADRYRYLGCASVMANIVEDEQALQFLQFSRTYLLTLVKFVAGESLKNIYLQPSADFAKELPTLVRLAVLDLLKEYGRKDNSEKLAKAISDFEESIPMIARLARLIQTANSMQGTLSSASLNVIRREIIKTLSFETENDTDLEADAGTYLGVESGTQEFKTSIVFPSDNNMQPDEFTQNRNVMRGICAFLNSETGGNLYIGVNDQGYITGVANDMKQLRQQTLDSYMRYIQDTIVKYFGVDVLAYIKIGSIYDNKVVLVQVESHPYRIVELEGVAYLRVNAESREMPEQVRHELIARKVFKDKDKAAAISRLQHAVSIKRCVKLHNYSSSNSGQVKDRFVEPFDVYPDDGLVACYDRDKLTVKVFKINRIGYVEVLENEHWKYATSHTPVSVDVFHMTGNKPIHVSLQLDLLAKNLLVEEFPKSREFVRPHKGDNNIWYFDTNVNALEGIGRFYLGLANHIKILDAPELEVYVSDFYRKYLIKK